ncbi:response regulator transcription factor [Caulobacter sp. RHG1]|uniref:response regulator transcription factor n=1 Tax=Caulobacter sp. (strain RHG1) TaxID=2545762 RepID=UPI0015558B34|nr:response regulator [Caulobacter sp. RHG1]NQE63159.1 hypothetical protein [Caulobacter sp. RHG1]
MPPEQDVVFVVDDDADLAESLARLLRRQGLRTHSFVTVDAFFAHPARPRGGACLLSDVMLGEVDGFQVARRARQADPALSVVFITAWPKTTDAVDAIRRFGGIDYLEKPLDEARLLAAVTEGLAWSRARRQASDRVATLSGRERQVLQMIARGLSSKMVALELDLSAKTVEDHRTAIRAKTGAVSLPDLIVLADALP